MTLLGHCARRHRAGVAMRTRDQSRRSRARSIPSVARAPMTHWQCVAEDAYVRAESGERVFVLLTSGSLSCAQSVVTLLQRDFDRGLGLAQAASRYDAGRVVGEQVLRDRANVR